MPSASGLASAGPTTLRAAAAARCRRAQLELGAGVELEVRRRRAIAARGRMRAPRVREIVEEALGCQLVGFPERPAGDVLVVALRGGDLGPGGVGQAGDVVEVS